MPYRTIDRPDRLQLYLRTSLPPWGTPCKLRRHEYRNRGRSKGRLGFDCEGVGGGGGVG